MKYTPWHHVYAEGTTQFGIRKVVKLGAMPAIRATMIIPGSVNTKKTSQIETRCHSERVWWNVSGDAKAGLDALPLRIHTRCMTSPANHSVNFRSTGRRQKSNLIGFSLFAWDSLQRDALLVYMEMSNSEFAKLPSNVLGEKKKKKKNSPVKVDTGDT